MTRNRRTSPPEEAEPVSSSPGAPQEDPAPVGSAPEKATDFRSVAWRVRVWTGNFLATCVILILGITFGRQVLQWWYAEPPSLSTAGNESPSVLGALIDPQVAQLMEFGDLPITLQREECAGDQEAALGRLRATCRKVAANSQLPKRAVMPFEAALLRRLRGTKWVDEGPGWKVFQNAGPILMVVAVRSTCEAGVGAGETREDAGLATESVVSWGLGLRQGVSSPADATGGEGEPPSRWTLFTYAAAEATADSGPDVAIPIPPGSRRTLSVRVEEGGALIGFVGQGSLQTWKLFFDATFDKRGWHRDAPWQSIGKNWHARYGRPSSGTCDVQLTSSADDDLHGILTVAPATPGCGEENS